MIGTIMWEYVLGGATLFGLIVGLFSIYNGRATRKLLLEEQRHTRELIAKIDERIAKMDEIFAKMNERFTKIDERFEVLLKALDAHIKASTIEHQEIMRRLTEH
ncbi:MAG: hypothetical protein LZ168_06015 [Thaumarchaeota archaeon]|jgi:uncharacterized membrane protein|nr:hypothetical protein [Candidatus Geocrenenecus arthurdayi]